MHINISRIEHETEENEKQKIINDEKYRIEELKMYEEAQRVENERKEEEERMLIELERAKEEEELRVAFNLEAEVQLQVRTKQQKKQK